MHAHAGTRVGARSDLADWTRSGTGPVERSHHRANRNRSTAITSRGGRLVPERVDAVEQVWTRATGTVLEPFWFQTCGVNTALDRQLLNGITNICWLCSHNNVGVSLREMRGTMQVMLGVSLRARWDVTIRTVWIPSAQALNYFISGTWAGSTGTVEMVLISMTW